jgi:hypothetical protein
VSAAAREHAHDVAERFVVFAQDPIAVLAPRGELVQDAGLFAAQHGA